MTNHDEIARYLRLTETRVESDGQDEDLITIPSLEDPLEQDLEDLVFRLRSYSGGQGHPQYRLGVEEGLELAASMVESLIGRHFKRGDEA